LEDALHRELFEEAGIQEFETVKPLTVSHFYRGERTAEKEIVLIVYWIRTNTETVTISAEHDDYRWVPAERALTMVGHPAIMRDITTFIKERDSA
jgi:8-oxo-dGTP pyrophosphatase MutT (NUDIX family)